MPSVITPLDPQVVALLVRLEKFNQILVKGAAPSAVRVVTPQVLLTLRVQSFLLAITKTIQVLVAISPALLDPTALAARPHTHPVLVAHTRSLVVHLCAVFAL